ncbi:MAG: hypothetical protein DRJ66_03390, partial [Thermoprotei archaeon]
MKLKKLKLRFVSKINYQLRRNSISVGIGEYAVARSPSSLATWALGSCVGIILYDPIRKLGSLSHCMLPEPRSPNNMNDCKYVSVAVTDMISALMKYGSSPFSLRAAVIGGANIFGFNKTFDVGKRNVQKAIETLRAKGIQIDVMDTGGNRGRNVVFLISTGEIFVSYTSKSALWGD